MNSAFCSYATKYFRIFVKNVIYLDLQYLWLFLCWRCDELYSQWIAVASEEKNPGNSHPRLDKVSGDVVFLHKEKETCNI